MKASEQSPVTPELSDESSSRPSSTPFLSVVIPVYEAEGTLVALCERLEASIETIGRDCEIILVDDRSTDGSWSTIQKLATEYGNIIAIRLSRNFGQHYAIAAGLDAASGTWTIVMDCDLQDLPEEIPTLIEKAECGFDIVLARRSARKSPLFKRLTSKWFYKMFSVMSGYRMDPTVGTFRIMRRPVVVALTSMPETYRLFGGLVQWTGFETGYVDVEHGARHSGKSTYGWKKLLKLALDGIVAFSNRPLYFSVGLGLLMSILSAAYGTSLIVNYLINPRVGIPGWLSTITISSFVGGLILLNLGIVGIYVGRIYNQTKRRPLYIVDMIIPMHAWNPPQHQNDL